MTDRDDYPDIITAFLKGDLDWETDVDVNDLYLVIDELHDEVDELNRNIGWLRAIIDQKMKMGEEPNLELV